MQPCLAFSSATVITILKKTDRKEYRKKEKEKRRKERNQTTIFQSLNLI